MRQERETVLYTESKDYAVQMIPRYLDIRNRYKSIANNLHPRQRDIVRFRCLHLESLLERVDVHLATIGATILTNADSIISKLHEILEFSKRRELEYRVGIANMEFAIRGLIKLLNLAAMMSLDPETVNKIQELKVNVIQSNNTEWEICSPRGYLEWITSDL